MDSTGDTKKLERSFSITSYSCCQLNSYLVHCSIRDIRESYVAIKHAFVQTQSGFLAYFKFGRPAALMATRYS